MLFLYHVLELITNRHLSNSRKSLVEKVERSPELQTLMEEYTPLLEKIFPKVCYWHGTGFYQYKSRGSSKYEGTHDEIYNVLESIIEAGGLKPHFDPWVRTNGEHSSSVSLANFRIYGRLYSQLHFCEGCDLSVEYGDRHFFSKFIFWYTAAKTNFLQMLGFIYVSYFDKRFNRRGVEWVSTISKKIKTKGNAISDFFNIVGKEKSDIPDNFGVLLGVKKEIDLAKIHTMIALVETRTRRVVELNDFTHIEVPLKHMDAVKTIFRKYGVDVPVIPMEVAEIYSSKFKMKELLGG